MRVLIAEDEPDIWKPYKIALESRDHETVITEDGNKCLEIYKKELLEQQKRRDKDDNNNERSNKKVRPPFDAVVLDYRMPQKDGLEVAKDILELSPNQRIIFASAYVRETLEDSVKQLKRVVELLQKPFVPQVLVDTIEDKEAQEGLKMLMMNLRPNRGAANNSNSISNSNNSDDDIDVNNGTNVDNDRYEPSLEQIRDLFEGLRKIQKGRTF
jgi:CheY-like chemotaxis protein